MDAMAWHPNGYRSNEKRLLPTNLPQTLQIGVYLLYWNAVLGLLFGAFAGGRGLGFALYMLLVVAEAAGGFGVANERKWGYFIAIGAAVLPFVLIFLGYAGVSILSLIFEIALLVALLHPMSRSYVKLWFR